MRLLERLKLKSVNMTPIFRKTEKDEYFITEYVTRDAFWNLYTNGCTEHYQLHILRNSSEYISELDFVAIDSEIIVGHIAFSKVCITNSSGEIEGVICLKSLAVLSEYQNYGIGTKLVKFAIDEAKKLGFKAIIACESNNFLQNFGFNNSLIKDSKNKVLALELSSGFLKGLSDIVIRFCQQKINKNEFRLFDKKFPQRFFQQLSA